MNAFFELFATILAWFYSLVPNYAVAIILLTLLVMVIVTPLTLKGTRSMMMMQQLQPEMRKIQQKYKDDRQKQNEELLKFYKENDINPLGGCLPLLVQAPVFIVLYQVLRGLTRRQPDLGFNLGWVSSNSGQPPEVERTFDPAYVSQDSELYQSLSSTTEMTAFGLDLSESASQALSQSVLHALPYLALIAIVAVTGFVQQRQIQGRNTSGQINPQQQMIMRLMPIILPIFSFGLPAGLVLYFAVSNLYRIGQQAFISRSIYGMSRKDQRENRRSAKGSNGAKPPKKPKQDSGGDAKASDEQQDKGSDADGDAPPPKPKRPPKRKDDGDGDGRGSKRDGNKRVAASSRSTRGRSNGRAKGSGGSSRTTPTLQPRARKKKR
jgi:YidC/Oxa1 family membrane protein insertase